MVWPLVLFLLLLQCECSVPGVDGDGPHRQRGVLFEVRPSSPGPQGFGHNGLDRHLDRYLTLSCVTAELYDTCKVWVMLRYLLPHSRAVYYFAVPKYVHLGFRILVNFVSDTEDNCTCNAITTPCDRHIMNPTVLVYLYKNEKKTKQYIYMLM